MSRVRVKSTAVTGVLLEQFDIAREVLEEWGVEFVDDDLEITLAELCGLYSLHTEDVIEDLEAAIAGEPWGPEDEDDGGYEG